MSTDQELSGASDTPRPRALPKTISGFLLSRQVEGCTEATIVAYRQRLLQFHRFLDGTPLDAIERADVDRYLMAIKERGCSPHYVNGCYRALRTWFRWLQDEEFLQRSPMRNIKPPKMPKRAKPFVHEDGRDALLALCRPSLFLGARNAAIVWLFWSTGIRLHELANLKLSDLDWDNSRITVFGKGQKERQVPFTKEAKKAVWRYLAHRQDPDPHLWLTEERRPANKWGITSAMRRLEERAGLKIKDMHHIFRRSWAMRQLKAGIPIKYVQLVGGWESVTVLEGYVKAMTTEDALQSTKWA